MHILRRVREVREVEHARLRERLCDTAAVVRHLREEQERRLTPEPAVDMFGDPVARGRASEPTQQRARYEIGPVLRAWGPFEEALLDRVDGWEMELWPQVDRWARGEHNDAAVSAAAVAMVERRRRLEPHLQQLRVHASVLRLLRPSAVALFAAIEAADAAEVDIVTALAKGHREVVDSQEGSLSSRGSSLVTERLRSPAPAHAAEERTARNGLMGRMVSWLRGA